MKRSNLLLILTVVLTLVLSACAAPAAAPAADSGSDASGEAGGDATCDDELGCVEVLPGDPIKLGGMLTISGATAFLGEDSRGGMEIAVADRGQVLGRDIDIQIEDALCSAEGGQTSAQKLASDPTVVGIVGTNCSSAAAAALPIISSAGLSIISPSNTGPTLTSADTDAGGIWQPGYYRTAHNDLFQGRVAAEFLYNERGITSLATIHDGSPYAESLAAVAAEVFAELGGEVTFEGAVNVGDTDMRPILTEIASNPPGALYFPVFEPESNFIGAQAAEIAGLEDVVLMSADGSLVDSFPENTGEAAVGMFLSGPYLDPNDTAYSEFLAKWEETFGGVPPSGFHAHAYDAANMLLDAVEAVGQESADGTLLIGRQALRDQLGAVADYQGLTGTLTCGETGDCATGEALGIYEVTQAEVDGNWPPAIIYTP